MLPNYIQNIRCYKNEMLSIAHTKRLRDATGDQRAGSFVAQRISLTIQRGNAASVFGTMPQGPFLDLF